MEVMTTLNGSAPSLWRHAEGCVQSEGMITSAMDPLKFILHLLEPPLTLGFPSYMWVHLWAFRVGLVVVGLVIFIVVSYIFD